MRRMLHLFSAVRRIGHVVDRDLGVLPGENFNQAWTIDRMQISHRTEA